jgi:hypothetical protein
MAGLGLRGNFYLYGYTDKNIAAGDGQYRDAGPAIEKLISARFAAVSGFSPIQSRE